MDHIDGNLRNDNLNNLRLICPNCNSQLPMHSGRNRNRVLDNFTDGYLLKDGQYKYFFEDSLNLMRDDVKTHLEPEG